MTAPTARDPWTLTLCWTPDQNFGAVAIYPGRAPATALVGLLRAGTPVDEVAAEFGISVGAVEVLSRLVDDLTDTHEEVT